MSWRATADIKSLTEGVTRSEKLVLLILADYHNEKTGQCNPPVRDIATDALMTMRRVQQILTAMSVPSRNLIAIVGREGGRTTAQYWLTCIGYTPEKYSPPDFAPPPKPASPQGRNNGGPEFRPTPEGGFTPGAKSPDVDCRQPKEEPSVQPQLEPKEEPQSEPTTAMQVQELLDARPPIYKLYEKHVGMVTGAIGNELQEMQQLYPADWITDAFEEAATRNKRSIAYIAAILARWAVEGRHKRPTNTGPAEDDMSARAQFLRRAAGGN